MDEQDNTWKCVDECLDEQNGLVCGTTDHFTSFAVLLGSGGGTGGGGPCGSSSQGTSIIVWLSLAAVLAAIIIVVLTSVTYELYKRGQKAQRTHKDKKLSSRMSLLQAEESKYSRAQE